MMKNLWSALGPDRAALTIGSCRQLPCGFFISMPVEGLDFAADT
jgi:hypothetical protein